MYRPIQHGFSLIEVLVALLILSVGLLGLAGMQVTGLRSVSNSTYYTQASLALTDLAERIRANPDAVDDNAFLDISSDTADSATVTISCASADIPTAYCSAYYDTLTSSIKGGDTCTPAQLATYDINSWFCGELTKTDGTARTGALTTILPNAKITIKCTDADSTDGDDCSVGSTHELVLSWDDISTQDNTSTSKSLAMTIQP